jgi:exonuclease VII large subunit
LEDAVAETEQRLSQQFSLENARALKEQQDRFDAEKETLKADLREAKSELKAVGQKLKQAQLTIDEVKSQLKRESEKNAAAAKRVMEERQRKTASQAPREKDEQKDEETKKVKRTAARESSSSSSGSGRYSEKKARVRVKNSDNE